MSNEIAVIQDSVLTARANLPMNMDAGTREHVLMLAASIRNGHRAAALQIAQTSLEMLSLKGLFIEEREFHEFAQNAFGWQRGRVYRYLKIGAVVRAHWVDENNFLNPVVGNMSAKIFTMLDGDTDPEIIEQLTLKAQDHAVTHAEAQGILQDAASKFEARDRASADRIADLTGTVANREAQIAELTRELNSAKARGDRAELQLAARLEAYSVLSGELDALVQDKARVDDELAALNARPSEVVYQDKEVPPAQYTSIEQAVADATARRDELGRQIAARQQELDAIESRSAAVRSADDAVARLRASIKAIVEQTPETVALAQASPAAMADVKVIAKELNIVVGLLENVVTAYA